MERALSDQEHKKTLLAQARQIGMDVDGRWSIETLAEKVAEAQASLADREDEAIKEAADTWVYPVRDCFLGTEKRPAGRAFKAPKELYQNWKATGAARLADDDEVQAAQD
jgi:hypothetical protein